MKRQPFLKRLTFALSGIGYTWREEPSFRFQVIGAIGAFTLLTLTKASPIWWALIFLVVAAILATELINTALERSLDHLHPSLHHAIGIAKDCAAAAVLVFSFASIGILVAYLLSWFKQT